MPSGAKVISREASTFDAVAHGQRGLASGVAVLVEADARGEARIGQRARRHNRVVDFHVVWNLLEPEADGVHRDAPVAQRGNRVEVDAAGVVGAVAEQHDRANGQIGGFGGKLLQAVADVCGAERRAAPAIR